MKELERIEGLKKFDKRKEIREEEEEEEEKVKSLNPALSLTLICKPFNSFMISSNLD
jgi:hypothetical protein